MGDKVRVSGPVDRPPAEPLGEACEEAGDGNAECASGLAGIRIDSTSLFRGRQLYSRRYHDEFSAGTLPFSRWPGFVVSRTVGLARPYACPSRICKSAEDRGFLCLCITGTISLIDRKSGV